MCHIEILGPSIVREHDSKFPSASIPRCAYEVLSHNRAFNQQSKFRTFNSFIAMQPCWLQEIGEATRANQSRIALSWMGKVITKNLCFGHCPNHPLPPCCTQFGHFFSSPFHCHNNSVQINLCMCGCVFVT